MSEFALIDMPDLGAAPAVSDVILRHLRTAIISGALDEGAPIRQDEVAKAFNVSKIPVREALKQLESEGFVTFQRNRGAEVATLSGPEIAQIFEVRAILEAGALRISVPLMTDGDLTTAATALLAFEESDDVSRWAELNWAFHSSLYQAGNRPYLMQMIRSANDRIERYLRLQLTVSGGHETAAREHRAILDACRARDAELAARLHYDHVMGACHSLHKHLSRPAPGAVNTGSGSAPRG